MEFTFKNIDKEFLKWRHEPIGDIQPKYWFYNDASKKILVKRQHSMKVAGTDKKSKMFNHFGEFFGYHIAQKANISACPVELVTLHDTKNKYGKTVRLYTGCASQSVKKIGEYIYSGEVIISKFRMQNPEKFTEILSTNNNMDLTRGNISGNSAEDNVDIVLASIVYETKDCEEKMGRRSADQIKQDIDNNLKSAVEMIVYDCLFGNSDRHSQNWSMAYDPDLGTVSMYPNYDNEAVLGFRKTEFEIKKAVSDKGNLSIYAERELFSRMGFSPMNSGVSYKNMLEYLVRKYPSYAIPAIKKITELVPEKYIEDLYNASEGITTRSDLSSELFETDEIPEAFKIFGTNLYSERREYAKNLIKRFKFKQSNWDDKVLAKA